MLVIITTVVGVVAYHYNKCFCRAFRRRFPSSPRQVSSSRQLGPPSLAPLHTFLHDFGLPSLRLSDAPLPSPDPDVKNILEPVTSSPSQSSGTFLSSALLPTHAAWFPTQVPYPKGLSALPVLLWKDTDWGLLHGLFSEPNSVLPRSGAHSSLPSPNRLSCPLC